MASSFSDAIEKIYQSFVLRDFLGFVLPGTLSLFAIGYLLTSSFPNSFGWLADIEQTIIQPPFNWLVIIGFLGLSYLTAWLFQSVHYGIVDFLFQLVRLGSLKQLRQLNENWYFFLWPVTAIFFYAKQVAKFNGQNDKSNKLSPSLITRGALSPDNALNEIAGEKIPPRMQDSLLYTERVSALMIMTGNLAIAGLLLLFVIHQQFKSFWLTFICAVIIWLLYVEHWRLWYTRNLRHKIYVTASKTVNLQSRD